ncbi:hypothetical protein P2318_05530 [Myxococcaceae bacterium GXIMD 01537]
MKRLVAASMVLAVGCAPLQQDTRTERGPLLRTYQKEVALGQRLVAGTVESVWPSLEVRLVTSDACRTEMHEEYAEEVITERHDPSAAPALSAGASTTLLGGGLLLARPLFSSEPDKDSIDREGNYGISSQKKVTTWGVALMAIGVPSLVTGIVQMARTGEERTTRKVDTVASLRDAACHARPAQGTVQLVGRDIEPPPLSVTNGTLRLTPADLGGAEVAALMLDDAPVTLSDADAAQLGAFSACALLEKQPLDAQALPGQSVERLMSLRALADRCRTVPGGPGLRWRNTLDEALSQVKPAAPPEGTPYASYEDALMVLRPALRVTEGSDAARLGSAQQGQALVLVGVLTQRQGPDSVVVEVGETRVLVLMDPQRAWAADFPHGTRVELVGVVEGVSPLGDGEVPLVTAAWMRPAI